MEEKPKKKYDLEKRSAAFAKEVRFFVKILPKTIANFEDIKQLIRASGSIGANYIEANESLGQKDFLMRIKILRKEAKESTFWLTLLDTGNDAAVEKERSYLTQEATELMMIFSSIMRKTR